MLVGVRSLAVVVVGEELEEPLVIVGEWDDELSPDEPRLTTDEVEGGVYVLDAVHVHFRLRDKAAFASKCHGVAGVEGDAIAEDGHRVVLATGKVTTRKTYEGWV